MMLHTIICMMSAMGAWENQRPMYGAAFLKLPSNDITEEFFVEMYHCANISIG